MQNYVLKFVEYLDSRKALSVIASFSKYLELEYISDLNTFDAFWRFQLNIFDSSQTSQFDFV